MKNIVRLGEIANIYSGGTPSRSNASYWGGKVPWVKTAQIQNNTIHESDIDEWITDEGLANSSAKLVPEGTILMAMYGQGKTRGQVAILGLEATINQACAAIELDEKVNRDFIYQQLKFRYNSIRAMSNTGSQENLSAGLIRDIDIYLPEYDEQKTMAEYLTVWDTAIVKVEKLIAVKERLYRYLVMKLLNNSSYLHGHVRDITNEVSKRNREGQCDRVLSVTNLNGFVLPEEKFERRVASSDLSNYKIVEQGEYAYNPSRINVGSIARLDKWTIGVLSPMYVVFKLDTEKVNSDFFLHWLSSHEARERIKRSAQGSVRETVSFTDLGAIPFPLPDMDKQNSVVEILNTAKQEIALLERLLESYRVQKRGLMQKLLTGEWHVNSDQEVA